MGYVGLPLAVSFAEIGIKAVGLDISNKIINNLNKGISHIGDIKSSQISNVINNKMFEASSDFSKIKKCDAIMICVPTPLDQFLKPDMSYVVSACNLISENLSRTLLFV